MSNLEGDEHFMRRAIELALQDPQVPFGAVIVRAATGEVVAEGHHRFAVDPVLHGEIDAIQRCALAHPGIDWPSLTLYNTAEPCPMCSSAILWAGISRVVFGTSIRTLKGKGWQQMDIPAEEVVRRTPFRRCELLGGVLEAECDALFGSPPGRYASGVGV